MREHVPSQHTSVSICQVADLIMLKSTKGKRNLTLKDQNKTKLRRYLPLIGNIFNIGKIFMN